MIVDYTFTYNISAGFNQILFPQPILVRKGSVILISQNSLNSTSVAVDTSGSASYSDMIWTNNLSKLNNTSNYRLYFKPMTNFSSYKTEFTLSHAYSKIGIYNVSILFLSSNQLFSQIVNITDCKLIFIICLHKTILTY